MASKRKSKVPSKHIPPHLAEDQLLDEYPNVDVASPQPVLYSHKKFSAKQKNTDSSTSSFLNSQSFGTSHHHNQQQQQEQQQQQPSHLENETSWSASYPNDPSSPLNLSIRKSSCDVQITPYEQNRSPTIHLNPSLTITPKPSNHRSSSFLQHSQTTRLHGADQSNRAATSFRSSRPIQPPEVSIRPIYHTAVASSSADAAPAYKRLLPEEPVQRGLPRPPHDAFQLPRPQQTVVRTPLSATSLSGYAAKGATVRPVNTMLSKNSMAYSSVGGYLTVRPLSALQQGRQGVGRGGATFLQPRNAQDHPRHVFKLVEPVSQHGSSQPTGFSVNQPVGQVATSQSGIKPSAVISPMHRLIPVPGDGLANQADQPCQTGQLGPAGPATGHSSIAGQTGQMGQPRPAGQAGHQAMPAIFSLKAGPHSLRQMSPWQQQEVQRIMNSQGIKPRHIPLQNIVRAAAAAGSGQPGARPPVVSQGAALTTSSGGSPVKVAFLPANPTAATPVRNVRPVESSSSYAAPNQKSFVPIAPSIRRRDNLAPKRVPATQPSSSRPLAIRPAPSLSSVRTIYPALPSATRFFLPQAIGGLATANQQRASSTDSSGGGSVNSLTLPPEARVNKPFKVNLPDGNVKLVKLCAPPSANTLVKINSPAPQGQQEKDPLLQRKRKLTTKPVFSSFNPTKNFLSKISRVPKSDASPAKKKRKTTGRMSALKRQNVTKRKLARLKAQKRLIVKQTPVVAKVLIGGPTTASTVSSPTAPSSSTAGNATAASKISSVSTVLPPQALRKVQEPRVAVAAGPTSARSEKPPISAQLQLDSSDLAMGAIGTPIGASTPSKHKRISNTSTQSQPTTSLSTSSAELPITSWAHDPLVNTKTESMIDNIGAVADTILAVARERGLVGSGGADASGIKSILSTANEAAAGQESIVADTKGPSSVNARSIPGSSGAQQVIKTPRKTIVLKPVKSVPKSAKVIKITSKPGLAKVVSSKLGSTSSDSSSPCKETPTTTHSTNSNKQPNNNNNGKSTPEKDSKEELLKQLRACAPSLWESSEDEDVDDLSVVKVVTNKSRWLDSTPAARQTSRKLKAKAGEKTKVAGKWRFEAEVNTSGPFRPVIKIPSSTHKAAMEDIYCKLFKPESKNEPLPADEEAATTAAAAATDSDRDDKIEQLAQLTESSFTEQQQVVNINGSTENSTNSHLEVSADLSSSPKKTQERPYKCSYCVLFFASLEAIRDHPCQPKFVCEDCRPPVNFTSRKELIAHLKFDHPLREFTCDECSYVSGTKTNLLKHIKRAHKKETPTTSSSSTATTTSTALISELSDKVLSNEEGNISEGIIFEGEVDVDTREVGDDAIETVGEENRDPGGEGDAENNTCEDSVISMETSATEQTNLEDIISEAELSFAFLERVSPIAEEVSTQDLNQDETKQDLADPEKSHLLFRDPESDNDDGPRVQDKDLEFGDDIRVPDAEEEVVDNDTVDDESPRKEDIVKQQPDFDCDPILEDAFTCSNCKHKFKTKNRFEHHKKLCSTSTSPLRPRFKQSQSLNPRLEMMAELERGLSLSLERELCRQCCRNNYKEASLKSHLRKCKGNYHKNFKIPCPFCKNPKRVFQTDSMLKSHMTAVHNNSSSMEKWRQIQKKRLEAQNKEYLRKSEKS